LNLSRISHCRRLSLQFLCRVSLSVVEISRVSPSVVSLPISYPFLNSQLRSLLSQWTSLHWWSLFDPDVGSRFGVLVRPEILKMMVLWCCCTQYCLSDHTSLDLEEAIQRNQSASSFKKKKNNDKTRTRRYIHTVTFFVERRSRVKEFQKAKTWAIWMQQMLSSSCSSWHQWLLL
jgi:hypothetical protein